MLDSLTIGANGKLQGILKSLRYYGWELESEPTVPESIAYCITKTRFMEHERDEHPDAMLRNLRTIALTKDTTQKHQTDFIEAVNWVEYQDILTNQRFQAVGEDAPY